MGFPGGSASKETACNVGDLASVPELGRSSEEEKSYSPLFWPGEFHGLYSPWDCKESEDFPGGSAVKNLLANARPQEMPVPSLGQEDPLEKEMATCSSILAWKIPWTQEPGRLQSMGSQRVRHY